MSKGARMGLGVIVTIIGLIALIFGGFFVYYAWQFKYGDATALEQISNSINDDNFTLANGSQSQQAKATVPINTLVRDHNPTQGSASAPVTVMAFIDFECPYCQESYATFKTIMNKYRGGVRFVFKHMPLTAIHPNAVAAAHASQCAHDQNKFWDYYNVLFTNKQFTSSALIDAASLVSLNVEEFTACLDAQTFALEIQEDVLDGLDLGVRGTPTYYINQTILEGVADESTWDSLILNELQ